MRQISEFQDVLHTEDRGRDECRGSCSIWIHSKSENGTLGFWICEDLSSIVCRIQHDLFFDVAIFELDKACSIAGDDTILFGDLYRIRVPAARTAETAHQNYVLNGTSHWKLMPTSFVF